MMISKQALSRLPYYLEYLRSLPENAATISATAIAEALGWGDVQVRKDLAAVSAKGKPKVGYATRELIADIQTYLGYGDAHSTVLVGVGNLGRALMSYEGFAPKGLDIVMGFDSNPALVGGSVAGKPIFDAARIPELCARMRIRIGILTVPARAAQGCCDQLTRAGVAAIWNFAPVRLTAPAHVLVHDENMASSLALLAQHVQNRLFEPPKE